MTDSISNILQESLSNAANLLQNYAAAENNSESLTEVFGDSFDVDRGNEVLDSVVTDFSGETEGSSGIAVEILPAEQINNAAGAYAADNSTIYVSEEFIADNADNPDAVSDVIIDSVGHHLDSEANSTDSQGDEGEIFAAEVTGVRLTEEELAILRGVEDAGAVNINGENVAVEQQTSIIYVDRDATGENNGTSWTNAYNDLQSALGVAGASDQIWVAEGTYFPTTDDDREISFAINNGVEVYGGFVGGETSLDQRDWQTNETILSGNIGESGQADNSYHVVDITGSTNSTIVDGFSITQGQADGDGSSFRLDIDNGGGIIGSENASATIRNSLITNNFASRPGGGIAIGSDSSINIINTTFINNISNTRGGAIYLNTAGNPDIVNSLFVGNEAQEGGAIANFNTDSALNISNSTFANNSAGEGDSIWYQSNRSLEDGPFENNIFWNTEGRTDNHISDSVSSFSLERRVTINNSIVQGGYIGEGENILDEDPLFIDPANGDYRLQLDSPARDAGNNEAVANFGVSTEVANNPRLYNETVDIGAYEYGIYASINDVTVAEGNEGNTNAEFTVTLLDTNNQPPSEQVEIQYTTANSTARSDSDYTETSGTLIFAPGESSQTITVPISGDTNAETDERFFVNLTNANGGVVITDDQGVGIIENDDLLGDSTTVYRFFNPDVGVHFYTASEAERDNVLENLPQYEFEGSSYISAPETDDPLTGIRPVYRFFNTSTGVHLYTINELERDAIVENLPNYNFEGIAYYAYESEQEGTTAVYRFYNQTLDAHFYTPSAAERDNVLENLPDYALEGESGISFYVEPLPA